MTLLKQPSDFFLFDLVTGENEDKQVDVVCFTANTRIDSELLVEALEHHVGASSVSPNRLLLIAPEPALEQAQEAADNERVKEALPTFTQYMNTPQISLLLFDRDGNLTAPAGDVPPDDREAFSSHLLREGLLRIFRLRKGMLRTGPGYHYVNPSGRHTKGFIRTGNVLLHSAEVSFIALGLLKWWPSGLRRIFVDTASISSVGYALTALRRTFEPELNPPTIDSFSSYGGMQEFGFFTAEPALCLISASTSGGLERQITRKGYLSPERVATLFYCGPDPGPQAQVLCDLTLRDDQLGEDIPESYDSAEECSMCRRGSAAIHISGDQFLPADPDVGDLVLAAEHAPGWLPGFLKTVVGEGIVRCHGTMAGESGRTREVYMHLNEAVEGDGRFSRASKRRLKTLVPASLAKIVYVEHPSSKALAEAIAAYFEQVSGKPLGADAVLGANQVLGRQVDLKNLEGPVMVVAGATSSGRTLLGISQFLRNVSEIDSIVYLVGIARPDSKDDWDRLHSNLTYGERPGAHPFEAVARIYLPTEQKVEQSPWAAEWRFLLEVRELLESAPDGETDTEAIAAIDARRDLIASAATVQGSGLTDDVFLPRVQDGVLSFSEPARLKLRPGFVFWRGLGEAIERAGSQADVYVTVLAILHRLRSAEPEESALVQHAHNRTVLSPANFGRFNDGVIQAALLRAARPGELDFTHDPGLSAEMRYMLRRFIEHMNDDEGEAAPEFLLAFARGQLTLTKPDEEDVCTFLEDRQDLPPFMRALRAWVGSRAPAGDEATGAEGSAESDSSSADAPVPAR